MASSAFLTAVSRAAVSRAAVSRAAVSRAAVSRAAVSRAAVSLLALGCTAASSATPATTPPANAIAAACPAAIVTTTSAGYDQTLSAYAYPYAVDYLPLSIQGTPACMAYMDVKPQTPNEEVVLLLHGKNFSGAYWHTTIARLVERGYRVVAPDQIGFGKSSKLTNIQYSFDLLAQNTARLLDRLHVERVVVVGHSMGGMLATRFATAYPTRTRKLVLVDPIGLEDYRRVLPYLGVDGWTRQALQQTPEGVQKYMRDSYFHGEWRKAYDPLLEAQVGWLRGPDAGVLARVSALTQDMIYSQPVLHDFSEIHAPTLLVIGQRDRTAPGKGDVAPAVAQSLGDYPQLGKRAANAIPGSRLVELDGVGHVPQYEAFDAWMAALETFLAGS